MTSPVPQSALVYATTDDGLRLPVIDITHPAFAVPDDAASVAALDGAVRDAQRRYARVPRFIMRFLFRRAARRSQLLADIVNVGAKAGFLSGLTTYIMKLGAQNLPPPFTTDVDRRMASSPSILALRLRLQQTAQLLAQGLEPLLTMNSAAPLALINIGGGPAIDSLNALILLRRRSAALLARRPIAVNVLDLDPAGPRFGAAALAALAAEGQPLDGLDIAFTHQVYDWNAPVLLMDLVQRAVSQSAVVAASSEGALFEYGSDDAIVANLTALHGAGRGAKVVVGSVTSADPSHRQSVLNSGFKLMPRGLDGFRPLAERAGYRIARSETTPLGDQVLLYPA